MAYTPTYIKPYPDGWENLPSEATPITAEVLDAIDAAITAMETQLKKTTEIYEDAPPSVKIGVKDKTKNVPVSGIFGANNDVSGECHVGGGVSNTVTGSSNLFSGNQNVVNGLYSMISGVGNTNMGSNTIMAGNNNSNTGHSNITVGGNCDNKAYATALLGNSLKSVPNKYDTPHLICGRYNDPDASIRDPDGQTAGEILFAVGNGTSDTERGNALLLDEKGNMEIKGNLTTKSGDMQKETLDIDFSNYFI